MSATERVRELLDERGVEWDEYGDGYTLLRHGGREYTVQPNVCNRLIVTNLTPEQAIAATLGRSECHDKNGFDSDTGFECTVCGTMVDSYMVTTEDTGHYTQFNFCPNCGRKVVDE